MFNRSKEPQHRWRIWWLFFLPARVAVPLAKLWLRTAHNPVDDYCLACAVMRRIKLARHAETVGAGAVLYCAKCGLHKRQWHKYCANRTKRINNKPAGRRPKFLPLFWE